MQTLFAAALFDRQLPPPNGCMAPSDLSQRFNVYRNNVVYGLMRALKDGFPATERIVGTDFFAAMAQAYVRAEPPKSPVLLTYGKTFPDFIRSFQPAATLPYLGDVAELEYLRRKVFHAAEVAPLPTEELVRTTPEDMGGSGLCLVAAIAVFRSQHPAVTIWAMNDDLMPLESPRDWRPEDAVIVRTGTGLDQRVEVLPLPAGAAAFITCLLDRMTFADAANQAFAEAETFDLTAAIAFLFANGLVAGLDPL